MQKLTNWVGLLCLLFVSTVSFAAIDLELSMTADKANVDIYKNVTYTLTVTNNGDENATGIGIDFPLPPNTAYTSSTASKGNYAQWTKTWTIDALAVGESASMDLVAFTLSDKIARRGFAEVIEADQTDTDSSPNNNFLGYPTEDDEAQKTVLAIGEGERDLRLAIQANQEETSIGDEVRLLMIFYSDDTETSGPAIVKANLPEGFALKYYSGYGFYDQYSSEWVIPTDITGGNIFFMELVGETTNIDQPLNAFAEIIAATHPDSDSTPNNDNGDFTPYEDDEDLASIEPYTGVLESDLELRVNLNVYPSTSTSEASFEAFFILKNRGPANNKGIWIDIELPDEISNLEQHSTPSFLPYTLGEDWYVNFLPNDGQYILFIGGTIEDETIPLTFYAEVREAAYPDPDSTPDNNSTQIPVEDDEDSFIIPPVNGTKPDLEGFIAEVTPYAIQQGETLEAEFQVTNVRGVPAPASKAHIWIDNELSYDPYHNEVELSLGMEDIPALAVGETVTLIKTYSIPNDFPSGEYYMYIKADGNNEIEEDIEENVRFFQWFLTIGGTIPNLYVNQVSVSPSQLGPGTPVTISCQVGNNGVATAPANTLKYYFSEGPYPTSNSILIDTDNIPELGVGESLPYSTDFVIPFDLVGNFYYILMVADSEDIIEEEYEMDNIGSNFLYIENAIPDLYFRSLRIVTTSQDTKLHLYGEVANGGFANSPATTIDYYLSEDTEIDNGDIFLGDGLVAPVEVNGEIGTEQVFDIPPSTVPYGEYYVIYKVNPNQDFQEGYFGDNTKYTRFTHVPASNSAEEFTQYYGTGKGVGVEETSTGYQILGRNEVDYLGYHVLDVKTDAMGAQTAIADYGKKTGKTIRTADNGYIQVTSTSAPTYSLLDPSDILITKRGASFFSPTWVKTYDLGGLEYGTDIYQTSDGGYVVTGYNNEQELFIEGGIEYERTLSKMVVLRIDADGNELWFNEYEMPQLEDVASLYYEQGVLVTQTNDGDFVVLASRAIPSPSAPTGLYFNGRDLRVYTISASGALQQTPEHGYGNLGTYYFPSVLKPTSDGGYVYVTGWGVASSKAGQTAVVVKADGSNPDWSISRSTSQYGTVRFNNVLENDEGNFITMGIYQPFNSEAQYLFHTQADGTEIDGFDVDIEACDMIQTSDEGYALTGVHNDQIFLKKLKGNEILPEGVDIELEYTVDRDTYRQWEQVNYTLTATNNGTETATNLVISDPIPFGMAFTSKTISTGTYNLWFQTWTIPELAAGETATLDLALFTLIGNAEIVKFAQVKSLDQMDVDSTPNNNSTTVPNEDDETAVSITPINFGGGSGKDVLENPIAESNTLKLYNLFPVPADEHINLVFGTEGFQVNLFLYDVNGRLLQRKSLQVNRGENALQLEVGHLTAGFYTVSLETPEGFVRGKFLKN